MKNLIFVLFVVLLFRMESAIGSANEDHGIRLRGNIENASGDLINGELKVYVQQGFHSERATQAILPHVSPIEGGKFEILLPLKYKSAYLSFSVLEEGAVREEDYGLNHYRFFLAENTDDLYFVIRQDTVVSIAGEGAKKWQIQHEIYQFGDRNRTSAIRAGNERDYKKKYEEIKHSHEDFIKKCLKHLMRYKHEVAEQIYKQIYYDIIGRANLKVLQPLKISYLYTEDQIGWAKVFVDDYFKEKETEDHDVTAKLNSVYYCNYLFERAYVTTLFGYDELPRGRLPFGQVYEAIVDKYDNPIVDKLIYLAFMNWGGKSDVLELIEDAVERMTSPDIIERMEKFKIIHSKGEQIYDFSLSDTLGRIYTPEDFKGKTVLADFWFTGCMPCKYLAIALDSLMKDYEARDDVVFLSVNVDKNESRWRSGLSSGEYSSPDQICVTTGGMDHPLLKVYQYDSFPKLLIFDEEGEIVSTNAPRPLDKESINELKALLE